MKKRLSLNQPEENFRLVPKPMIRVNFRDDWQEFVEGEAPKLGLRYSATSTLEQNTIGFLNGRRRSVPRRPRVVHESREFRSQSIGQHATDYLVLKKLIGEGGDLTPYLSRNVQRSRSDENDKTLNAWGLHHLHFRPSGTRDVLFLRITDSAVFVVKFLPHGSQHRDTWVDPSLLWILHENWPETSKTRELRGITPEPLNSNQRIMLREKNVNFAVAMQDGAAHVGAEVGITAAGRCIQDLLDADRILAELDRWQQIVEENEAAIRSALNMPPPQELWIRMRFEEDGCWLYEAVRHVRIALHPQAA
jgi:hypothetical protein